MIVGPFTINAKSLSAKDENSDVGLNHDYMREYGIHDGSFDELSLEKLTSKVMWRRALSLLRGDPKSPKLISWVADKWFVDLQELLGDPRMVVSYAFARINVTHQRRLAIMAGSADGLRCWLNGELIINSTVDEVRDLEPYSNVVAVNLRSGSNIVACKIDRLVMSKDPGWAYRIAMTDMQSARKILQSKVYRALDTNIVHPGGEIRPLFDFFETPTKAEVVLTDLEGVERFHKDYMTNSQASIRIPNLYSGVFHCTLRVGDVKYESYIYVGYLETMRASLLGEVKSHHGKSKNIYNHISVWLRRVEHLMLPEHYKPADARWQFKVINAAKDIEGTLRGVDGQGRYVLISPGYHIRAYESRIDRSIQYYGIHVPKGIKFRSAVPVVLNINGIEEHLRPFEEGTRVSDIDDEIERLDTYATRYGVLIVDPFGRGNARGAPIQEMDFMEVLADVKKDYKIDRARIYITGMCEGGREAIAMAEHFPSVFAAVAADIPGAYSEGPDRTASEEWMRNHDIAQMAYNLGRVPVMVQHGDHNDHIPLQQSQALVDECRRVSGNCELQILPDSYPRYSSIDRMEHLIQFLIGKARTVTIERTEFTSVELKYGRTTWIGNWLLRKTSGSESYDKSASEGINKNPSTSGPIADMFAGPVMLVTGTRGPSSEQRYAGNVARLIREAWYKDFFTVLPETEDKMLTLNQFRKNNLLIIGSKDVNSAWTQLSRLPISVKSGRIVLEGKEYRDSGLVIEAVFPNPFNRDRYVTIISTNSEAEWTMRDPELWFSEGSYDYSIYSAVDPSRLIDSGIMNSLCCSW